MPGAELRIRAPRLDAAHRRAFMRNADYQPVPTKILRNADGTRFALFPATATDTFAPGQYRLRLEFRRNNKSVDQSSTILRQAGRDTSEAVELDIPWITN
jgi:hypothetical protein